MLFKNFVRLEYISQNVVTISILVKFGDSVLHVDFLFRAEFSMNKNAPKSLFELSVAA